MAWGGLFVVVGYAFFLASVKAQLNEFYARFYDLLQMGGEKGDENGSGDISSYSEYRARVTSELWSFAIIIAPLVSASPACKWARSAWAFSWRMALMRSYRWKGHRSAYTKTVSVLLRRLKVASWQCWTHFSRFAYFRPS